MFDYIKIEGFRSFKSVELEMPRLAVLIGPNGGGKSNLIDLLMLLSEAGNGELSNGIFRRGGFRNIAFGFDVSTEISLELRFKGTDGIWLFAPLSKVREKQERSLTFKLAMRSLGTGAQVSQELVRQESPTEPSLSGDVVKRDTAGAVFRPPDESGELFKEQLRTNLHPGELVISQVRDASKYAAPAAVLRELGGWTFYRDIDVGPKSPIRQPVLVRPDTRLWPDGTNLSNVLRSIKEGHPQEWADILEILGAAYPGFSNVTIPAGGGDGRQFFSWFERPYDQGLSANLLSDGTLKLLCLVAILKSPDPPPLICIDEPELGLHPDWIKLVAELLQDAADRTQVIVATHSPHIVAKLEPEQVIVTDKEDGQTTLEQLTTGELKNWLKDFNLADLWLAGHFGGRP